MQCSTAISGTSFAANAEAVGERAIREYPVAEAALAFENIPPKWYPPVLHRCMALVQLEDNWDTYKGRRVEVLRADAACHLLGLLMSEDTPIPQVVPTPRGNIQFEWHLEDQYLELEVLAPTRVAAYFQGPEEEWEEEFGPDLTKLAEVIRRLG
ncbi:MAG: hypothetical protein JW940_11445 [Polyangiaceae bacterium]|nr:hypothetical protein [Polyangiaceae bacterium]